jgi:hypothetical protein
LTTVVNLYGGPGTGKSTTAAALFSLLKQNGIECELVREYAKDVVWEGRTYLLENQIYIFAKQLKRQLDLRDKVAYIITDSPILLSAIYGKDPLFQKLVKQEYQKFDNFDVLLGRVKPYHTAGRVQTEAEAIVLDEACRTMLNEIGTYHEVPADEYAASSIQYLLTAPAIQDGTNSSTTIIAQDTNGLRGDEGREHLVSWLEHEWKARGSRDH